MKRHVVLSLLFLVTFVQLVYAISLDVGEEPKAVGAMINPNLSNDDLIISNAKFEKEGEEATIVFKEKGKVLFKKRIFDESSGRIVAEKQFAYTNITPQTTETKAFITFKARNKELLIKEADFVTEGGEYVFGRAIVKAPPSTPISYTLEPFYSDYEMDKIETSDGKTATFEVFDYSIKKDPFSRVTVFDDIKPENFFSLSVYHEIPEDKPEFNYYSSLFSSGFSYNDHTFFGYPSYTYNLEYEGFSLSTNNEYIIDRIKMTDKTGSDAVLVFFDKSLDYLKKYISGFVGISSNIFAVKCRKTTVDSAAGCYIADFLSKNPFDPFEGSRNIRLKLIPQDGEMILERIGDKLFLRTSGDVGLENNDYFISTEFVKEGKMNVYYSKGKAGEQRAAVPMDIKMHKTKQLLADLPIGYKKVYSLNISEDGMLNGKRVNIISLNEEDIAKKFDIKGLGNMDVRDRVSLDQKLSLLKEYCIVPINELNDVSLRMQEWDGQHGQHSPTVGGYYLVDDSSLYFMQTRGVVGTNYDTLAHELWHAYAFNNELGAKIEKEFAKRSNYSIEGGGLSAKGVFGWEWAERIEGEPIESCRYGHIRAYGNSKKAEDGATIVEALTSAIISPEGFTPNYVGSNYDYVKNCIAKDQILREKVQLLYDNLKTEMSPYARVTIESLLNGADVKEMIKLRAALPEQIN